MTFKYENICLHILAGLVLICGGFSSSAQAQPSGGKVTAGAAPPTSAKPASKPTKPTASSPTNTTKSRRANTTPRATGGMANVDGKWWTSGNDFGASEVVFSQTGSNVAGVIRYADGRTGSVTGTMVGKRLQFSFSNSAGVAGTGWLELSWNNFLGGPWRNQQTRDGSWTLSRIEGNWCFAGSRDRIRRVTHDAAGRLHMITEDGTQEEGRLDGSFLYLHSEMGNIKGDMDFRGNRVQWSTGFFWKWCGR